MQQQKNRLHTLNSLCTLPYHAPTSFEGIPKFYRKWNFEKKGRKRPFTGILPFEQVVESKKCLGGQKRSSALLVRVCCCLPCISNLPWASRPTPLKTSEQHLTAALWGLGRGAFPLLLRPRSCPRGELFRSPFPFTIFLSLLSPQSKDLSLPLPGPRSPPLANYEVPSSVYVCYRVV